MSRFRKSVFYALIVTTVFGTSLPLMQFSEIEDLLVVPAYAATDLMPFGDEILTIPENQDQASFTSEQFTTETFYAAQVMWHDLVALPGGVKFFVRAEGQPWYALEQDIDAEDGISLPTSIGPASNVQLRVELERVSGVAPQVFQIQLSLVDPGKSRVSSVPQANANEVVISRKQWGADESLRLTSTRARIRAEQGKKTVTPDDTPPVPTTKPESTTKPEVTTNESDYGANCSVLQAKYADEFKLANIVRANAVGEAYTWPIAYTTKLRKLIVHHTEMTIKDYDQNGAIDSLDYQAAVRAIYYFHSISRDWGDIGYNYLIDPAGTIYEGRAGGDLAIGAHSLCKNNGALGIALLGSFTSAPPTEAALKSLQSLLQAKGKEYNINLQGSSLFYGSLLPNVVGHKDVRATSCPGDYLYALLPQLRSGTLSESTQIIFPKSTAPAANLSEAVVSKPLPVSTIAQTKKTYKSAPFLTSQSVPAIPGDLVTLNIQFRNQGNTTWNSDTMLRPVFLPSGVTLVKQAKQSEDLVAPDGIATFLPQLLVDKSLAKSKFNVDFYVVPDGTVDLSMFKTHVQVIVADIASSDISLNGASSDTLKKNLVAAQVLKSTDTLSNFLVENVGGDPFDIDQAITSDLRQIRIKLSMPETYSIADSDKEFKLVIDNVEKYVGLAKEQVVLTTEAEGLVVKVGENIHRGKVVRMEPQGIDGIVTLVNFNHAPAWNPKLNDNQYRGVMEWRIVNSKLTVINELLLEDYLKGLAEVSNSAPFEKQRLMAIIARSYALYYMVKDEKFPGLPYHLDDSPDVSQKYLGYGYEKRSPAFLLAVLDTKGEVVTYQGEVVKTPYFNKSDGRTRSAKEVWGWDHTPYLVSVPDPLCQNTDGKVYGHGVGLSGCGSEEAAKRGYSAEHIIGYYYPGTAVEKK